MANVNPVQVQRFLQGVDYPVSRDELIRLARQHGADENVLSALRALPAGKFETPADVSKAVGQIV